MADGPTIVNLPGISYANELVPPERLKRIAHDGDIKGSIISGLAAQPILIQRDITQQKEGLFVEPVEFISDGTAESNKRANTGVITIHRPPPKVKKINTAHTVKSGPQPTGQPAKQVKQGSPAIVEQPATQPVAGQPEQAAAAPEPVYEEDEEVLRAEKVPKTRVMMSGPGMPKMTLFFQEVYVSPSLVILGFADDGESAIVEPPQATTEAPLSLTIAGQVYLCANFDFNFQREDMTFLALVRVPSE